MTERVLTVVSDLGLGGTQRVAQRYAEMYRDLGYRSEVLGYDGGGVREQALHDLDIPVYSPSSSLGHVEAARQRQPDLIHLHRAGSADARAAALLHELVDGRDVPVLETNVFGRPDYTAPARRISLHAHVSLWSMWKWRSWGRWRPAGTKGLVLPNVCETASPSTEWIEAGTIRARHQIPDDAFLVGRIGQPHEAKWSAATVVAFERLATRFDDAWLLLVGAPPSIRGRVAELPPHVGSRVRVSEPTADERTLASTYAALDVFLHSSAIGESFGMVLAESLLCETPVVTLSTPLQDNGQVEVVGHGVGGVVAIDVDELVEGLARFRTSADARAQAAKAGADRIRRLYGTARVQRRLGSILPSLLGAPPGSASAGGAPEPSDELEREILADLLPSPDPTVEDLVEAVVARLPLAERALVRARHHPLAYLLSHPADLQARASLRNGAP